MINPDYYTKQNTAKIYLGGKIAHYMRRPPAVVLKSYPYAVSERETMYTIGRKVFGDNTMYLWTIIADTNKLRQPDDWIPGEIINLPDIVLNPVQPKTPQYEPTSSFTTVL